MSGPRNLAVRLIDVIWLAPETRRAVAAFEVELTALIYSGIVGHALWSGQGQPNTIQRCGWTKCAAMRRFDGASCSPFNA